MNLLLVPPPSPSPLRFTVLGVGFPLLLCFCLSCPSLGGLSKLCHAEAVQSASVLQEDTAGQAGSNPMLPGGGEFFPTSRHHLSPSPQPHKLKSNSLLRLRSQAKYLPSDSASNTCQLGLFSLFLRSPKYLKSSCSFEEGTSFNHLVRLLGT